MSPEDEVTYLRRLSGPAADHVEPQGTVRGQAARDADAAPEDRRPDDTP